MINRDDLTRQVLRNCAISDARHAGLYSLCGLAMRLRDLYKWEHGLEPWIEKDSAEIVDWIGRKEDHWEELAEEEFREIRLSGQPFEPFDVEGINAVLEPEGLFYGAGLIHGMKPTFFLALLDHKTQVNGHGVYILGRELARDLFTIPALSRDGRVLIRRDAGKYFFWDQIFFIKKSGRSALRFALESYGVDPGDSAALRSNLTRIYDLEMHRYIYHELGEMEERVFDRGTWREIISAFPHSPIELLARTVRDLLADTNGSGTLQHVIRERSRGSLGFYAAFLDGLAKELFPEMGRAFAEFSETEDWSAVERAMSSCFQRTGGHAETMCRIFREGKRGHDLKWTEREITENLLEPLGIMTRQGENSEEDAS